MLSIIVLTKRAMAVKTLFSSLFSLAAFIMKFILFYSLGMLVPTTIKTEEPDAVAMMETEEPRKMECHPQ